jgi:DNA-binding CsgD family transcriptional regulator
MARLARLLLAELTALMYLIVGDLTHPTTSPTLSAEIGMRWHERLTTLVRALEPFLHAPEAAEAAEGDTPPPNYPRQGDHAPVLAGMVTLAAARSPRLSPRRRAASVTADVVSALPSDSFTPHLNVTTTRPTAPAPRRTGASPRIPLDSPRVSELTALTAREQEILALADRGIPPRKIAKRLQLSVQTVYTHLRNARRKQRAS